MTKISWSDIKTLNSKSYTCGYCDEKISSEKGYIGNIDRTNENCHVYICHSCNQATFFDRDGEQTPRAKIGNKVEGINDQSVSDLYDEARNAAGADAPTATVMACRVILMHIAVKKGAKKKQNFGYYVDYLNDQGYVPKGLEKWPHVIRKMGNKANHDIEIMTDEQSKNILNFTEVLLKIIYEMPEEIRNNPLINKPKPVQNPKAQQNP